jgi:hypothetical protein
MSWKKIIALAIFLAALVVAIATIEQSQKDKAAIEGTLLDIPATMVKRIELRNKDNQFVFERPNSIWQLVEPMAAKADRVALESILDNFCQLKYDRLLEADHRNLHDFGLDKPEIELKLIVQGKKETAYTILLGMRNNLDDSSYAQLAGSGKIVTIAAYKRNDLEKDLFAFRNKIIFEFDNSAATSLRYNQNEKVFYFEKKENEWFMEKPVYSLAHEAKVNDILSAASMLEALSFVGAANADTRRAYGLEKPLLTVEFPSLASSPKIMVGEKNGKFYAWADGTNEICEIHRDFLEKFSQDGSFFREKKIANFFAFDVKEFNFKEGDFVFAVYKNNSGIWEFSKQAAGKRPSEEKVDRLLTSLADCEALDFIDKPKPAPGFATRIAMKVEDAAMRGQRRDVIMEFSAAKGETIITRNPRLPYYFNVAKEILESFPKKIDDITEEPSPKAPMDK